MTLTRVSGYSNQQMQIILHQMNIKCLWDAHPHPPTPSDRAMRV